MTCGEVVGLYHSDSRHGRGGNITKINMSGTETWNRHVGCFSKVAVMKFCCFPTY